MTDRAGLFAAAFAAWADPGVEAPLADPYTLHVGGRSVEMHPSDTRAVIDRWRIGFPDLRWETRHLVVEGDLVAAHLDLVGTHLGTFRGHAPTARRVVVEHMFFAHFEGEAIAELWEVVDPTSLTEQLGA